MVVPFNELTCVDRMFAQDNPQILSDILQGDNASAVRKPIPVKGTKLMEDYGNGHQQLWEKDIPKDQ